MLFNPGATSLGQSGPGSDGNEEVLRIPQISSITGTSPSYPGQGGSYFSAEKQSVYSKLVLCVACGPYINEVDPDIRINTD